jgi:glutamyl-Q tRNA(Asp) synthetase
VKETTGITNHLRVWQLTLTNGANLLKNILRRADLLDNTPRQMYLQDQLGYPHPVYIHLPLVLDENQEKLSKQTKATAIATHSKKDILTSLREAAKHIGLTDSRLYKDSTTKEEPSVERWLEVAIENYRQISMN